MTRQEEPRRRPGSNETSAPRVYELVGALPVLLVSLLACGQVQPVPPVRTPSPSASWTLSDAEIADARSVRSRYGLRTDRAWIESVARDPTAQAAVGEFGVPLTRDEYADVMSRRWPTDVLKALQRYGRRFPQDYAGAYANLKGSGFVFLVKGDAAPHRAALAALAPKTPIDVRQVEWSLRDLEAFEKQLDQARPWVESVGARIETATVMVDNTVQVRVFGSREVVSLLEERYPTASWLKVVWAGQS